MTAITALESSVVFHTGLKKENEQTQETSRRMQEKQQRALEIKQDQSQNN